MGGNLKHCTTVSVAPGSYPWPVTVSTWSWTRPSVVDTSAVSPLCATPWSANAGAEIRPKRATSTVENTSSLRIMSESSSKWWPPDAAVELTLDECRD